MKSSLLVGRKLWTILFFLGGISLTLVGCGDSSRSANAEPSQGEPVSSPQKLPPYKIGKLVIDGPEEDQAFIASVEEKLIQETAEVPSPFGRKDAFYNGHIFWDADIWVFPAICFLKPENAKLIPQFRARTMNSSALASGAWEVSKDGLDVTPTQSRNNISGPGWYTFGLYWGSALGFVSQDEFESFREAANDFYSSRAIRRDDKWSLNGVKSVDEYAEKVDNDFITNLLAEFCKTGDLSFKDPSSSQYVLDFRQTRRSYQQETRLLSVWPLQNPYAETLAKEMLEESRSKINDAGPAMSLPIQVIAAIRFGDVDDGYKLWKKSWKDFTDENFLFRENRKATNRTYFLTGAAGSMNSVLYGFLGFRIDSYVPGNAKWSVPLRNGLFLSITPRLPKSWKKVEFREFVVLGKTYNLIATHDEVTVTEGD